MEANYSQTPLFKKLGLKKAANVVILNHPIDFLQEIGSNIQFSNKLTKEADLIIFFTKVKQELSETFPNLKNSLSKNGSLWIAWPKKAAKVESDLDENQVMQIGLENGLVDVKVISIDDIWSGLKFVYRIKDR